MGNLLVTYSFAWAAVSVYVAWLALVNQRLTKRLDRLEDLTVDESDIVPPSMRVA